MDWSTFGSFSDWKNENFRPHFQYQDNHHDQRLYGSEELARAWNHAGYAFLNAGYRPQDWDDFFPAGSDQYIDPYNAFQVYLWQALQNGSFPTVYEEAARRYSKKFGNDPLGEMISSVYGSIFGFGGSLLGNVISDPMASSNNTLDYLNFGLGVGTAGLNFYNQQQALKAQNSIAQANNALSREMFYEGNLFNHNEALEAFKRSYEASKYSTQLRNMLEAGLNPAMMFGEGNTIQPPQSQAGNSESVPSLQGASQVVPQLDLGSLGSMASALESLARAKNIGIDTSYLEQSLKYRLASDEANSRYAKVLADIKQKYGDEREQKELKKIDGDIKKIAQEIDTLIAQEGLINEQAVTELYNGYVRKCEYLRSEKLYNAADALEDYWKDFVVAELTKMQNEGRLAGVQASWLPYQAQTQRISADAQAEDLRATRQARIDNLKADARQKNALSAINEYDFDTRPNKISASWHNFTNMVLETIGHRASTQYLSKELDLIGQEIERAKKNNDWYLVNQLMDNAKDIAISLGSAAIAYKTGKDAMGGKPRPIGFNK